MKALRLPLSLAILFFATFCSQAAQTNSLLNSWLASQTNFQTWSADFIQTRNLKSLAKPLTASGHISFAAPNRFHWEIKEPSPTIALRAESELWVIYPKLKRAERYPLSGSAAGPWRDTLALLEAGFPRSEADIESKFRIQSQTLTNDLCEVTLQPKSASARRMMPLLRIAFSTNDFSLRATELQFADGSTMRNDFTNGVFNPTLPADLFSPQISADFTITEPTGANRR
jgi:Outer membrane lipoprotein-sorting protein